MYTLENPLTAAPVAPAASTTACPAALAGAVAVAMGLELPP